MRMSLTGPKFLYLWVAIFTHLPVISHGQSYSRIKECFIMKGESMGLQYVHVDKEEAVDSLEECMRACKQSFIYCKSFSYSDKNDATAGNCLLSRKDTATLDIRSSRDFRYDARHTYYELSIEDMCQRRGNGRPSNGRPSHGNACFSRLVMGRRVSDRYIRERTRARDIRDCEDKCLRADYNCFGFNYKITSNYGENCELSSKDTYNLDPSDTYYFLRDEDYDYYERKSFEGQCRGSYRGNSNWYYPDDADERYSEGSRGTVGRYNPRDTDRRDRSMRRDCFRFYRKGHRLDRRIVKYTVPARDYLDCVEACLRHQSRGFICRAFAFSYYDSYGSGWYGRENCQLTDMRSSELNSYHLIFDSAFDVYTKDEYSRYCENDDEEGVGRFPRSVTVSGLRCHHRSYCQMHDAGRFYFCDTEDGGWDYCCRPDDFCDYSNGYSQKWCYVGTAGYDQWRPCVTDDRDRWPGRSRAYLKAEKPDVKLMLQAPSTDNRPKGLDLDHPIDIKNNSNPNAN